MLGTLRTWSSKTLIMVEKVTFLRTFMILEYGFHKDLLMIERCLRKRHLHQKLLEICCVPKR